MPASYSEFARRRLRACCGAAVLVALTTNVANAVVFYARDEALKLAFPDAERVEARDFFLTATQHEAIENKAKTTLDSDLLTVYVGHRGGRISGYAMLDTHVVRTLPETFMIVLDTQGLVTATHMLAFYEPTEYMPNERWLKQFKGKRDVAGLRVGRGIAAVTGSTLTSHAVTAAVRRALAAYDVLLQSE